MRPDIPRQPVFASRHMLLCRGMSRHVSYFTHVNDYSKELPRSTRPCVHGYVTRESGYGALVCHRCSTSRRASMPETCNLTAMRQRTLHLARASAWPFVPPCGCVLFGLACAVPFSAGCVRCSFHLDGACLAVRRRRPWHTVLGNVFVTPATGKGYGAWRAWHRCTFGVLLVYSEYA
jgi:hypothetical protein